LFKSWQIFIFSLVPLALVFTGVIIGSMRGIDAEKEIIPTVPPRAESPSGPAPTAPAGATALEITAKNLAFDKSSLTAKAGQPVQVTFHNEDVGVLHNVSFYTSRAASQAIHKGDLTTGVATVTYNFNAPSTPGTYFFHCDVHPDMQGNFVVN
jgi:plastocyanin